MMLWRSHTFGHVVYEHNSPRHIFTRDCILGGIEFYIVVLRMKKLKEEMEGVVKELAENNLFLER